MKQRILILEPDNMPLTGRNKRQNLDAEEVLIHTEDFMLQEEAIDFSFLLNKQKEDESYTCQLDIDQAMERCCMQNWITRTCHLLRFNRNTCKHAAFYMDQGIRKKLQKPWHLLAATAVWVASKLNENFSMDLRVFLCNINNLFTPSDILSTEELLCHHILAWKMNILTVYDFVVFYLQKLQKTDSKGKEWMQTPTIPSIIVHSVMTTLDTFRLTPEFCSFLPSIQARSAIILFLGKDPSTKTDKQVESCLQYLQSFFNLSCAPANAQLDIAMSEQLYNPHSMSYALDDIKLRRSCCFYSHN